MENTTTSKKESNVKNITEFERINVNLSDQIERLNEVAVSINNKVDRLLDVNLMKTEAEEDKAETKDGIIGDLTNQINVIRDLVNYLNHVDEKFAKIVQ